MLAFNGTGGTSIFAALWSNEKQGTAHCVRNIGGNDRSSISGVSGAPFALAIVPSGDSTLAAQGQDQSVMIGAADPLMGSGGKAVTFTIGRLLAGPGSGAVTCKPDASTGSTEVTVQLPTGLQAGETATGAC